MSHRPSLCLLIEIKFCDQEPCNGSNACQDVGLPPYFMCLQCPHGKTGIRCDVGKYDYMFYIVLNIDRLYHVVLNITPSFKSFQLFK